MRHPGVDLNAQDRNRLLIIKYQRGNKKRPKKLEAFVGAEGFEPPTLPM